MMLRLPPYLAASSPEEVARLAARRLQARIRWRRVFQFHADTRQERLLPLQLTRAARRG